MILLDQYIKAKDQLYAYFGYKDGYANYPIDDSRRYFWYTEDNIIHYADSRSELISQSGNYYTAYILKRGDSKRHSYTGNKYTAFVIDTQVAGQRALFSIFSNDKFVNVLDR